MTNEKLIESLTIKINSNITKSIESDDEYYFSIGQVSSYLLSKDLKKKKTHFKINTILNSKNNEDLKKEVIRLFKKHSWRIKIDNKKFNNLCAMVIIYKPTSEINTDLILQGYLSNNLIYEKQ